jgi:predicted lactoylglutathione lyase
MAQLYINLPVSDLSKATAFYEAIGFTLNPAFSNTDASAMVWDDTLSVMLLTPAFCANFLGKKTISDAKTTTEVLNALQFDSRAGVDAFFEKAIAA